MASAVHEPEASQTDLAAATDREKSSYGQILKSTALVGGSSVLNIAIGIVRTKAMALLLGPAGFGLMGLYGSILDLAHSVAGMGINSSGVRQIAEAAGSGDKERIALTAATLRRVSVLLGVSGAILLALVSRQASSMTFGSPECAGAVALLSVAVYLRLVAGGQGAMIQGMRRIADFAKLNVLGALFGTLITIPVVYFYREDGVVPSLIAVAAASLAVSWWYSRKVQIPARRPLVSETWREARALLKLGFAFMASGLMMMGSAYMIRIIVLHKVGVDAVGLYQAAWTLGGLYVGLILQAMGADFYPRLTAVAKDDAACTRLVNEQARVGLLLAGPGIIATLTLAPLVIATFYSAQFAGAVEVLRWICLGVALRTITWPMGYIVVARGEQWLFFWTELAWTIVNVGLTWILIGPLGLAGVGAACFIAYLLHGVVIYTVVRRISGFRWTAANLQLGLLCLALLAAVFCALYVLPVLVAVGMGMLATVISCLYSTKRLLTLVSTDIFPPRVRRLFISVGSSS